MIDETPAPNRERLIKLAEWAGAQEARRRFGLSSEWEQADWLVKRSCGTACCLAGKVALEDGGIPVASAPTYDYDLGRTAWEVIGPWDPETGDTAAMVVFGKDAYLDTAVEVGQHAQQVLGLTTGQADELFESDNDFDDVVRIIGDILAEES